MENFKNIKKVESDSDQDDKESDNELVGMVQAGINRCVAYVNDAIVQK